MRDRIPLFPVALLGAVLFLMAGVAFSAENEGRVALVIGNSAYKESPLANPGNDAADMAKALGELGFKVILRRNTSTRAMRDAIREFGKELRRAQVGLFYYAGHGVQIRGGNYLIPVGADIRGEADVEDQAIDATYVLRTMEEAQAKVNIVILDACRNNPYTSGFRSASRGLAQMTAATGTLIAFSTAPGSIAADGTGRNGLYTQHLLASLRQADTDILKVFQRTRAGVVRETGGKQTPWESTSLTGDFYFRPGAQVASAAPTASAVPAPAADPEASDRAFWESVKDSKNPDELKAYLEQFPNGQFASLARARLKSLQAAQVATIAPSIAATRPSTAPGISISLLSEILSVVDKQYVTKPDLTRFLLGGLRGLEKVTPAGALSVSPTNDGAAMTYLADGKTPTRLVLGPLATVNDLHNALVTAAGIARDVAPALDQARLEESLFDAALANLDRHSGFLNPEQFREFQVGAGGTFGGLGIELAMREGDLSVVSPIEGTPAFRSGILPGDRIIQINSNPTKDVKLADAVKQMRGPPGVSVTLGILREGWTAPRDFKITRELIRVQSVRSQELDPGVGYLSIRLFQQGTPDAVQAALDKWGGGLFGGSSLKGLILDLRNDPGGLLNVSVEVAGKFLDEGRLVVQTESRTESGRIRLNATAKKRYTDMPMVVLVNEGSAAASEIVAAALQDWNRAVVVGNRTFGKGLIQTIIPLAGGSALRLSTADYRTPKGRPIEGQGVEPDLLVAAPASAKLEPAADVQLQKGLERLKAMMAGK